MLAARTARLVAWLASTALFATVLAFGLYFVVFLFTWRDCAGGEPPFSPWVPVTLCEGFALPLAVREWRLTNGRPPGYLWWLVVGFGPAVVVPFLVWAFVFAS
jgi:hypothetical protein